MIASFKLRNLTWFCVVLIMAAELPSEWIMITVPMTHDRILCRYIWGSAAVVTRTQQWLHLQTTCPFIAFWWISFINPNEKFRVRSHCPHSSADGSSFHLLTC
jgi:hypothetical protein